jgi:arsenite methyltransferase
VDIDLLADVDLNAPGFPDLYDELPLWSAPFGLLLLDRVPLRPGSTILDVGAGTGFLTVELAQRAGPGARVIAVDPWVAGMERLRRKVDALGLHNVETVTGDAAALDLPVASVDVIVSNLGVNNFENAPAVLAACARVARPGASLLLATNLVGHMAELYAAYAHTLEELGHRDRLPVLEAHVRHRATIDGTARLLSEAGFDVAETVTGSFRFRFGNGAALLRHHFIRLGFLPAWRTVARPDAVADTLVALQRNLDAAAERQGGLDLTIPMACFTALRRPAGSGARDAQLAAPVALP